jgi:tetratricopeptide (TPR) repeat protein
MDDRDEKGSGSAPLGARMRSALGAVREQGAASLRGVRRSAVEATNRLKSTQAAERLGAAVEIRRSIKKAADAQRRGNHPMAYRLLEPEVLANPDDARLVVAFWSAALACERPENAIPALLRIIRRLASAGEPEQAAELWLELRDAAPSALVDPSALVRIAPALQASGRSEQVVRALREAVDSRNDNGLSPGLAVRVAEMARALDPPTALTAARRALTSPDLHEAKRVRLEDLVAELEKAEAPAEAPADAPPEAPAAEPAAADETPAPEEVEERAVDDALAALAPAARFADVKVTEAMPTKLREEAIALQLQGGRKVGLEYAKIEAVAVAEVRGLADHPVVVIDLVLNWGGQGDATLRVVRLRSDGFDPRMVIEAPEGPAEAFHSFLSELLERSNALPLPDPDGELAVNARGFDDIAVYQREILHVDS